MLIKLMGAEPVFCFRIANVGDSLPAEIDGFAN